MRRSIILASSAAFAGLVVVAGPLAASASNNTPSSISLNSSGPSPSVAPSLGNAVSYTETYPSNTKNPVIETNCYQNGAIVWGEVDSVSSANQNGVLLGGDSSAWLTNGGSASCTASLESRYFKSGLEHVIVLASTSFTAAS